MKKLKLLQILALGIGLMLFTGNVWGQETIFHECVPTFTEIPAGWTSNNGGGQAIFQAATDGYLLVDHIDDWVITSNYDLSNYQDLVLNVSVATYGSGDNNPLTVDVSNDGGATWTHQTLTSNTPTSTTYIPGGPFSITAEGTQVKFRFWRDASSGKGVRFINIHLTGTLSSGTPLITVSPPSLTGFTYVFGSGPSAEQSFTVAGSDLTANITVTPPANYEISQNSGSGFAGSAITLTQTGGAVAETTIYVRLKAGLVIGPYNNEDITATSTDAADKIVTCSGEVTEVITEPSNHPTGFAATANASNAITVVWVDAAPAADGYLIKGSATSYEAIVAPADGTPESDGGLVKNIAAGVETHQFFGLSASTQYFFKIYPYNGTGTEINYKIDESVPQATATTDEAPEMPKLIISEVADPGDVANAKFVELYNSGEELIDFSQTTIYLSRQANGSTWASAQLSGTISPKETYVISYSPTTFNSSFGFDGDQNEGGVVTGNGDDGYFLFFDGDETTGILMDAYGEIDIQATSTDGWYYQDARAVRNSNITSPNATWTATEWTITAADVADCTPGEHNGNISWKGGAGNWNTAANWSNGSVPTSTDNVIVPNGATLTVDVAATVNNINVQDGGELTINTGQGLSVSGMITIEDGGSFINDGTLDDGIAKGEADAIMQRHIPAYTNNADGWHLLASPVGTFSIDGSAFDPGTTDDFYGWNEVDYMWMNHKQGDPSQMIPGTGYLVAYENAATKDFVGTFNNSDIILNDLTKTAGKGEGWHLLGNPFQSALKWETANWNPNSIGVGAKIMNPGGTYTDIAYAGANEYIPANQGFFVQAEATTNSITIPTVSREHNSTAFYKSEKQNLLTLRAADGEFYVETWIQMMDGATADYDENFDIRFLGGMYNAPHLYSLMTDGDRLSTNRIGDFEEEVVVPLGFKSFLDREFTMTAHNAGSFGTEVEVYLIDSENDLQINLKETTEYTFAASANEVSERFKLLFFKSTSIHEADIAEQISIYSHGQTLYLKSPVSEDARIAVYNITGQQVHGQRMTIDRLSAINLNLPTGWYVVSVITDKEMATQKVFIR